jgi:hypothetical protein
MTHELASREQPGRAGPHDQDGRDGFASFTGIQSALLPTIRARGAHALARLSVADMKAEARW